MKNEMPIFVRLFLTLLSIPPRQLRGIKRFMIMKKHKRVDDESYHT